MLELPANPGHLCGMQMVVLLRLLGSSAKPSKHDSGTTCMHRKMVLFYPCLSPVTNYVPPKFVMEPSVLLAPLVLLYMESWQHMLQQTVLY